MILYLCNMAGLNKNEKLICEAAKSRNAILRQAFALTASFLKADGLLKNDDSDYRYFEYLYTVNHKAKTFYNIATKVFNTSVSTLEDRRKEFVTVFNFYFDLLSKGVMFEEVAAVKNE